VGEYVRETPISAMAVAAAAGFLIGGGLKNRLGLAILGITGRVAIQGAATTFMAALATGNDHNEAPNRAGRDGNGYDKRRGNVQESG
jgi:hypothetical protein